jgi:hypothetical protein
MKNFSEINRGADAQTVASNKATAIRLGKAFEKALQTENGEVEILPGFALPVEAATRFIEIARADEDHASDGDLALNLRHYLHAAALEFVAARSLATT